MLPILRIDQRALLIAVLRDMGIEDPESFLKDDD